MAERAAGTPVTRAEFDDLIGRLRVVEDNAIAQSARLATAEEKIATLEAVIEDSPSKDDA